MDLRRVRVRQAQAKRGPKVGVGTSLYSERNPASPGSMGTGCLSGLRALRHRATSLPWLGSVPVAALRMWTVGAEQERKTHPKGNS